VAGLVIARCSPQSAFVVIVKSVRKSRHISRPQVTAACASNKKVSDQGIGLCYCLLDTASFGTAGDVQLRGSFLMRQQN